MINIDIKINANHITVLTVKGHAEIIRFKEKKSLKTWFGSKLRKNEVQNYGSIPCAAVSILVKSFIDALSMYAIHKKSSPEKFFQIIENVEGSLQAEFIAPDTDPMHVYRFATEQMLIIGFEAVAQEYQNDVKLNIENVNLT